MGRYRRRVDIIAAILNAAGKDNVKKTKIMYSANLSYRLLQKYLNEALNLGFMQVNNDGYEVTERGRIFLEKYENFSRKYFNLERELENLRFEREVLERMCMKLDADPKRVISQSERLR